MIKDISANISNLLKEPLILVAGDFATGKVCLLQNLCGTEFKSVGSGLNRCYLGLIVTSTDNSPIKYNYPMGEYLYRVTDEEALLPLIENKLSEKEFGEKTEVAKAGMDKTENFIVYVDSLKNDNITYACRNIGNSNITLQSTDVDGLMFNESDIIIFMLSENEAIFSAVTPFLLSCLSRWRKEMMTHIFFLIPKCDRYSEKEINNLIDIYENRLNDIICNINPELTAEIKIRDRIFPYSSIYRDHEGVTLTNQLNLPFYNSLYTSVSMLCNVQKIAENLDTMLCNFKNNIFKISKLNIDNLDYSLYRAKIITSIAHTKAVFKEKFSVEYKKILNVNNIISIMDNKNKEISRKKEDRQRLLRIVNIQLTDAAMKTACKEVAKLHSTLQDCINSEESFYLKNIYQSPKKTGIDYCFSKNDMLWPALASSAIAVGAVLSPFTLPVIIAGLTVTAATSAVSYYAQSEATFKKNTAKKIVSEYSSENIYEKICEKINQIYFDKIENDLFNMHDNKIMKSDQKLTVEYIDRLHDTIQKYK